MQFLSEPEPPRGVATVMAPGVRRLVAPNPGAMTYHGTNTYLIDGEDGLMVLDPGPLDATHTQAVLAAAGRAPVRTILVSHRHRDHIGGVAALRAATGAPVLAAAWGGDGPDLLLPDRVLGDAARVGGWEAIHTPGHAADHLAFAREDGTVFSGDHVMAWSSTAVSPPEGDMTDYVASLQRLLARDDRLYLPGHGPALTTPAGFVEALLEHRRHREAAVASALGPVPASPDALVASVYGPIAPALTAAATRNVLAHLHKLQRDGLATGRDGFWVSTAQRSRGVDDPVQSASGSG